MLTPHRGIWASSFTLATRSSGGPVNVTPPVISGDTEVGSTLTCTPGTWTELVSSTFQWYVDGVAISGETSLTYITQASDDLKTITCVERGSLNGAFSSVSSNGITVGIPIYESNWFATYTSSTTTQIEAIAMSPSGTIIASEGTRGVANSASILRSTDSGDTWVDVGYTTSADMIQSISYVGNNGGNETWIATLGQNFREVIQSTDDGLTWTSVFTAGTWERTYTTFSIGGGICFVGGRVYGDYIWRSTDYGATFTQVKGDSGANNIEDFVQTPNGDIYAVSSYGSGRSRLYKSTDSGATWSLIYTTTGNEEYLSITAISDTKLLMGADVEQIYESTDSGVTWSLLSTTPNNADEIFVLRYDSLADKLFMGVGDTSDINTGGIYSSDDQGATWTAERLTNDRCIDLILIPSEARVLACTGRGSSQGIIWTNTSY